MDVRTLISRTRLGLAVLAAGLLVAACDFSGVSDSIDDFDLVIGLDEINTVVAGQMLDARTGELVEQEVELTFSGEDADAIIDLYSDPMTEQSVEGGLTSFGLVESADPSGSDPVTFTVTATASGYLEASEQVRVTGDDHEFSLFMTDEDAPPEGASATSQRSGQAGSDGSVSSSFSVETPTDAHSGGSASLSVQEGTVAEDASGSPLSGELTTDITYFSGTSGQALRAFPGGAATGPNGRALVTGGFASVTVTDGSGRRGTSFSRPIDLGIRVPESTVNPNTGRQIRDGETIGIYSYDRSSGAWVEEGEATIVGPPENGTFGVEFESDHLSYFSTSFGQDVCAEGATVSVNRNGNTGPLSVTVEGVSGGFSVDYTIPAGQSSLTLSDVPSVGVEVTVTGTGGSATATLSDACSGSATVDLPAPAGDLIDVDVTLVPSCPNAGEEVRVSSVPAAVVYYRLASSSSGTWSRAGTVDWTFNEGDSYLERGTLSVSGLVDGETYTFKTTYDGDTYTKQVTISGSSKTITEDVDADYCE